MNQRNIDFIKANKVQLREVFNERIEQLKDNIFSNLLDNDKRDLEIRFVQEYKEWLRTIGVLENTKTKDKQSYK